MQTVIFPTDCGFTSSCHHFQPDWLQDFCCPASQEVNSKACHILNYCVTLPLPHSCEHSASSLLLQLYFQEEKKKKRKISLKILLGQNTALGILC